MAEMDVINRERKPVAKIDLEDNIFACEVNKALLHEDMVNYLARARAGTANARNRVDVRGGGAKPWRQKGTGRARHGSRRSPLWTGGGIIHGPSPRDYGYSFPRKKRWGAVKSALSSKVNEESLFVIDGIDLEKPKTKELVSVIGDLDLSGKKVLILDDPLDRELELASRNLENVKVMKPMQVRSYNILNTEAVLFTRRALEIFQRLVP